MNKVSSYIQCNWIKLLLIIIVPLVFWLIVYSDIDQVKYDESVRILYIGDELDASKLQENITSNLNLITNQELKSVSVMCYSGTIESVYEYLRNRVYNVDIVIISEKYYNEDFISQIFVPLTTKLKQDFNGCDFVDIKEKSYGLEILEDSDFYKYHSKNEKVTVFLSQHSLNIGKAYGYGKVENDSAISISKYILGVM